MYVQLVFCVLASTPAAQGLEIAKRIDAANSGYRSERAVMQMKLINAHGDETLRRMNSITQEQPDDGDRSKLEFLWPADVKGTRMLTWSHKSENDDQWLYLPALSRVKRISSRGQSGSFMGSEFAYEDLGSQEIEKYTYSYVGEQTVDDRKVWVIDRFPVRKSGYSRLRTYNDQGYMNAVKVEYFDRKGELLKTARFFEFKKIGAFWRASRIHMVNHQTQKQSELIWSERKLGVPVDDDAFDVDSLED